MKVNLDIAPVGSICTLREGTQIPLSLKRHGYYVGSLLYLSSDGRYAGDEDHDWDIIDVKCGCCARSWRE